MNIKSYIARTNKKFEEASAEQKRVMIAKDVLLRIQEKVFRVSWGQVVSYIRTGTGETQSNIQLKSILNDNNKKCSVCAKGALFCSIIGRVNHCTVEQVNDDTDNNADGFIHSELRQYFSLEQLDLIETAFENNSYLNVIGVKSRKKAHKFYEKRMYNFQTSMDESDLLIDICNNIIENNGTFKP